MKSSIIIFLTLFPTIAAMAAVARAPSPVEAELMAYFSQTIPVAARWAVEHGIQSYRSDGQNAIATKLLSDWRLSLTVPVMGDGNYLARFGVGARGMYANILCLYRFNAQRSYEYWVVQFSGHDTLAPASPDDNHCLFLITEAQQVDGARRVLHEATTFFPSYRIDDAVEIRFPLDDLKAVYNLQAWRYPVSFPDSDLKNWEMGFDREKQQYVRRPYSQPKAMAGNTKGSSVSPSTNTAQTELSARMTRLGASGASARAELERILSQSEQTPSALLFGAGAVARDQRRLEDAGFLFYAAYLRTLLDQDVLPQATGNPRRPRRLCS